MEVGTDWKVQGRQPPSTSTNEVFGSAMPSSKSGSRQVADRHTPAIQVGASASGNVRAALTPGGSEAGPSVRPSNPTPTEAYDSLRGVPAFTEPGSDYVEEWTPYTCELSARTNSDQPNPSNAAAPALPTPTPNFRLTQAVFEPPARPAFPPRSSPVFRPPSPSQVRAAAPVAAPTQAAPAIPATAADTRPSHQEEPLEEEPDWATDDELHRMVSRMATFARHVKAYWDDIEPTVEECNRTGQSVPRLRTILRQERARFERMREYLGHLNVGLSPNWVEEDIWDRACTLHADEDGNLFEDETDAEEEVEWRRKHPR